MSFWWGYAVGSALRGGGGAAGAAGGGAGGLVVIGVFVAIVMELITPTPPKEISQDDYKGLIAAAGASCTGLSVLSHHLRRPKGILSDKLSPIQDILIDRIQHGDRTICGLPPRAVAVNAKKSAKQVRAERRPPAVGGTRIAQADQ